MFSENIRGISTSDIDELAQFQINKNRRYTQLHSGVLNGHYLEINLGNVQVFREHLTAGVFIEAAPVSAVVPFAALLSNTESFKFCGKARESNSLLQATGGTWDASCKESLHYVVAAFNRQALNRNITRLTGEEIPADWLISKAIITDPTSLGLYALGLDEVINRVNERPEILTNKTALRMLCDGILQLTMNVLTPTISSTQKLIKSSNRHAGVKKVIEYLHAYAEQVPTIPELCTIANLSERNLQYGFKEYLGITPIRYLRLVRLNGVKRDLLIAHPKKQKVVDVALNWGFIELGRFAQEYYNLFQELPSVTLNKYLR